MRSAVSKQVRWCLAFVHARRLEGLNGDWTRIPGCSRRHQHSDSPLRSSRQHQHLPNRQVPYRVLLQTSVAILAWWALGHGVAFGERGGDQRPGGFAGGRDFFLATREGGAAAPDAARFAIWMMMVSRCVHIYGTDLTACKQSSSWCCYAAAAAQPAQPAQPACSVFRVMQVSQPGSPPSATNVATGRVCRQHRRGHQRRARGARPPRGPRARRARVCGLGLRAADPLGLVVRCACSSPPNLAITVESTVYQCMLPMGCHAAAQEQLHN